MNSSSSRCQMKQADLHRLFKEADYGANSGLFAAYFDAESKPPRCCVCHSLIGEHAAGEAVTASFAPVTGSAITGSGASPTAAASAEPTPFVVPPIPEHDEPHRFQHRAPPPQWLGGWRNAMFEIGAADAEGTKLKCLMPVATDTGAVQPCGTLVNHQPYAYAHQGACQPAGELDCCPSEFIHDEDDYASQSEMGRHLSLQHQIHKPPVQCQKRRPWRAPLCPVGDCCTLCDCLFCPFCFCNRLEDALRIESKLNVTYYIKTAKTPGDPVGVECGSCCACCGWWSFSWTMLLMWTLSAAPPLICFRDQDQCVAHRFRSILVSRENIYEGDCTRRMISFCCTPCDLVQVHRELRTIGVDPGTTCCRVDPGTIASEMPEQVTTRDLMMANPVANRTSSMF